MKDYFREQIAIRVMSYVGAFATRALMDTPFYETVQNINFNVDFLLFLFSVASLLSLMFFYKDIVEPYILPIIEPIIDNLSYYFNYYRYW